MLLSHKKNNLIRVGAHPNCHDMRSGVHPGQVATLLHNQHRDRQPFTLTIKPMANSESPTSLTRMALECVKKLEDLQRTHNGRTCKLPCLAADLGLLSVSVSHVLSDYFQ